MPIRSESHVGKVAVSASERPEAQNAQSGKWDLGISGGLETASSGAGTSRPDRSEGPELSVYANNEYVFATFPITLALFWDKGGEEI